MFITKAKELIKNVAKSNVKVPIMMVGEMGIGKTQIVEQVADELSKEINEEYGFVDLRLATQEPGEIIGYPRETEVKGKHGKRRVMVYSVPEWFPEEGTRGVIFLDELNRAHVDTRQAIMQFVKERRLHLSKLPDGWKIVSAINPDNGEYQVETLDKALVRRFCMIKVEANLEEWLKWAHNKVNGVPLVDDKTTGFIAANKKFLYKEEDFPIKQEYSPDNWTMLSQMKVAGLFMKGCEFEIAQGLIGSEAAALYIKWIEEGFIRPVTGTEILEHYDKVADILKLQRNDEDYITMAELNAELWANDKPNSDRMKNLVKFIKDAKPEVKASFCSDLPPNYINALMHEKEVTEALAEVMKDSRT